MKDREYKGFGARVIRDSKRLDSVLEKAPNAAEKFIPQTKPTARNVSSFLKALGTDWRVFRANKIHDHRMTITIDGQKYTIYMRKG